MTRAYLDIEYRLRHFGPDITQENVKKIIHRENETISALVNRGIKGISKYTISFEALRTFNKTLPISHNEFIEYAKAVCPSTLVWQIDNSKQGMLFSGLGNWRLAIIDTASEFEWPKWYLANGRHEWWINVKLINGVPIAYREDVDNNIQEIPINTEFINDLL